MANKRISELALRTPQASDLMLIGDPTTGYSYKATLSTILGNAVPTSRTITINGQTYDLSANRTWSVGTVTSVGLSMPSAFTVTGGPVTGSGTLAVTANGNTTQYIAGDGSLVAFPIAGQAGTLVREVRNETGATLTKGTVVYINGASGNKPTVTKAIATSDTTSAQTFGVIQSDISNNSNGYLVAFGDIIDLDTSAFAAGSQLYLSATVAGGFTDVKQYAPNHLVYVGVVTRSHPTQGRIEVRIQNGYEMDELHDVAAQSPSDNDILQYKSSTGLWTKVAGTTSNIAEGTNLYFTQSRARQSLSAGTGIGYDQVTGTISSIITQYTDANARAAISLTTTGDSGAASYNSSTGVLNIPNYTPAVSTNYIAKATSMGVLGSSQIYDNGTSVLINTTSDNGSGAKLQVSGAGTFTGKVKGSSTNTDGFQFGNVSRIRQQDASTRIEFVTADASAFYDIAAKAATFSSSVTANGNITVSTSSAPSLFLTNSASGSKNYRLVSKDDGLFAIQNTGIADLFYLNASGNVGIGVTPSAWSVLRGLQNGLANIVGYASNSEGGWFTSNAFYNGTSWAYQASSQATMYQQLSGVHSWHIAPSGTAGNAISFTQAMTLNASGNLALGVTSAGARLEVRGTSAQLLISQDATHQMYFGAATTYAEIQALRSGVGFDKPLILQRQGGNVGIGTTSPTAPLHINTGSDVGIVLSSSAGAYTSYLNLNAAGGGAAVIRAIGGTPFLFEIGGSEAMRITSDRDVLIGATGTGAVDTGIKLFGQSGSLLGTIAQSKDYSSGTILFTSFEVATPSVNQVGSITYNGSAVAYNTSSDYRLKTDLKDFAGIDIVNLMKVYDYQWLSDSSRSYGVLAHELQSVLPYAVTGVKDGEMMQEVDYSKIVPVLIKAIQELNNKISRL